MAGGELIDLRVARAAARLVLPAPAPDPGAAAALREAVLAELPAIDRAARDWTQLGAQLPPTTVRVVGRMGWVDANLTVLAGLLDRLAERLPVPPVAGRRLVSVQVGSLLGLLSTRVLGQFVLPLAEAGTGQLVVVGPNVLDLARRSPDLADDLRRTVLLHEVAHRLQFDANPWLGAHLRHLVAAYLDGGPTDLAALARLVGRLPSVVAEVLRGGGADAVLQAVLSEEQARTLDEAQAVMSLLEGHGNVTMRLAAPGVVDDPDAVAAALDERRGDLAARVLRQVAGMARKERQYTQGEAFVRAVCDAGGVARLNRAFEDPAHLPAVDEIADPGRWLARVPA